MLSVWTKNNTLSATAKCKIKTPWYLRKSPNSDKSLTSNTSMNSVELFVSFWSPNFQISFVERNKIILKLNSVIEWSDHLLYQTATTESTRPGIREQCVCIRTYQQQLSKIFSSSLHFSFLFWMNFMSKKIKTNYKISKYICKFIK